MQVLGTDTVDAPGVWIDAVVAVHERFEAHQVAVDCKRDSAELHKVMRRLSGRLAVECDKAQLLDRRLRCWPSTSGAVGRVVDRREGFVLCGTEARNEPVTHRNSTTPPSVAWPRRRRLSGETRFQLRRQGRTLDR